jgi:hypothetical protein
VEKLVVMGLDCCLVQQGCCGLVVLGCFLLAQGLSHYQVLGWLSQVVLGW